MNEMKQAPQDVKVERALLGAVLSYGDLFYEVSDFLLPECFYLQKHRYVWEAIEAVVLDTKKPDILTVVNQLRKDGKLEEIGGAYELTELTQNTVTDSLGQQHAAILRELFIRREQIRIGTEIINKSYDDTADVFEMTDKAMDDIYHLTGSVDVARERVTAEILRAVQQDIKEIQDGKNPGIFTGFEAVDKITGGYHDTDLVVLAGRPGMGKTANALSSMHYQAFELNKYCAFFSLEMSDEQLMKRLLCVDGLFNFMKLRRGEIDNEELFQQSVDRLSTDRIRIYDQKYNINSIRAACKRLKSRKQLDIVYVDYIQLIQGGKTRRGGTRDEEVGYISRTLKLMAKELDVPVIALSQLSRAVEKRGGDKKPMMSDLRESGSLEQDADVIIFVYRPEYYGLTEWHDGTTTNGMASMIFGKNRHGSTGEKKLGFNKQAMKFHNKDSALDNELPPLGDQEGAPF